MLGLYGTNLLAQMQILLIHGLARTSLSLVALNRCLRQAGHTPEHFSYVAWAESFDAIVQRLRPRFQNLANAGPYAVVAHSLGGVLTRSVLGLGTVPPPDHVVMLGTPNQPPRLAPLAWKLPPFRWLTGSCGFNLTSAAFYATLPPLPTRYTLVAGTGGFHGPLSPFGDEPNDGLVAVTETLITPSDPVVRVPVWHTFMMNNPAVQRAVVAALHPTPPPAPDGFQSPCHLRE
ncbi:MAG: esterase/lipase family protein [Nodosilinea sp.]